MEEQAQLQKEYNRLFNPDVQGTNDEFTKGIIQMNKIFNDKLAYLIKTARNEGYRIKPNVYAGVIRSAKFNARVIPVNSGMLILINYGLYYFLAHTTDLIVRCLTPNKNTPPEININQARKVLQEYTKRYIETKPIKKPFLSPPKGILKNAMLRIFDTMLDFIVAHELAHILAGHLQDCNLATTPFIAVKQAVHINKLDNMSKTKREFEADEIAVALISEFYSASNCQAKEILFAAPILFFEIDEILKILRYGQNYQRMYDHPPSEARGTRIMLKYFPNYRVSKLKLINSLMSIMYQLRKHEEISTKKSYGKELLNKYVHAKDIDVDIIIERLEEIWYKEEDEDVGFSSINLDLLKQLMKNQEQARAATILQAIAYQGKRLFFRNTLKLCLVTIAAYYMAYYPNDGEFINLLKKFVPNLNDLIVEETKVLKNYPVSADS